MEVSDAYVFPGFLTPVLTQLLFPKPPTTFLTCFGRGERQKYAGKKSCLNWGPNSQPPGHEFDTLNTEPPVRGLTHHKLCYFQMVLNIQTYGPHFTKVVTNKICVLCTFCMVACFCHEILGSYHDCF